jgi:uncharacterized protein (TIGR03435 family)
MGQLAGSLVMYSTRVVVDQTDLQGRFDYHLEWTPAPGELRSVLPRPVSQDQSADLGPSIFAALQEQLGLRLESTTGPTDVLVIDHVEHPTAD